MCVSLDALYCYAGTWGQIGQAVVGLCEWEFLIQEKKTQEANGLNLKVIMESRH